VSISVSSVQKNTMQSKRWFQSRNILIFSLLVVVLVFVFLLNIAIGSVQINLPEVADIIIKNIRDDSVNSTIVWTMRLPRSLAAVM